MAFLANRKLDNDMLKDVSGGEIGITESGRYEVLKRNGYNIFIDNRSFKTAEEIAMVARFCNESCEYFTVEDREHIMEID